MNIYQWESCIQSGCCICSQSIKNNNTLMIQSVVCNPFNATKRSFCINMWPGSTTSPWSQISSQPSEQQQVKVVKVIKKQTSAGKVLASVFWDVQSILFTDYFEKGRTKKSQKNGHKWRKKKMPFHQDNVPCHKLITMMAKLHELHFELLLHLSYSPNLAPSNYWLFADLKRMLQGKRLNSNEEVILDTEAYFEAKDKFYKKGIKLLEKHWNQYITLEGDYVDE